MIDLNKLVAIDLETAPAPGCEHLDWAALNPHTSVITIAAIWTPGAARALSIKDFSSPEDMLETLFVILWAKQVNGHEFVFHNQKFDLRQLCARDARFRELFGGRTHDTMLMAMADDTRIPESWLEQYEVKRTALNKAAGKEIHRSGRYFSLKSLAPFRLGVEPFWEVANHANAEYSLKDTEYTWRLAEHYSKSDSFLPNVKFYNHLRKWSDLLLDAELNGIDINMTEFERLHEEAKVTEPKLWAQCQEAWQSGIDKYERTQTEAIKMDYELMRDKFIASHPKSDPDKIAERYENLCLKALANRDKFNPNSPTQLSWLFGSHFGYDIRDPDDGKPSTGKAVLQRLAAQGAPGAETLLKYRKTRKALTSYFAAYPDYFHKGRLHPFFNMNTVRTGRLSSDNPNIQQVPPYLKTIFVPGPEEEMIVRDLSNIEPILIAYFTEDPELCAIMINGRNIHDVCTKLFFNLDPTLAESEVKKQFNFERKVTKEGDLSLFYGAGAERIMKAASKHGVAWTKSHCETIRNNFKRQFRGVFEYKKQLDRKLERGEVVKNLMGRPIMIPDPDDVFMTGFNTTIQSSGSDLLTHIVTLWREACTTAGIRLKVRALVHDEAVATVPKGLGAAADKLLVDVMNGIVLQTKFGKIPVRSEGGVCEYWTK